MRLTGRGGLAGGRRGSRSRLPVAVVTGIVALAVAAAGCSPSAPTSGPVGGSADAAVEAGAVGNLPLPQAFSGPAGTWATLAMGQLGNPLDTFWELFDRTGLCAAPAGCPSIEGGWVLATPPGVATNGGLIPTANADGALTVGFGTSIDLQFSPVAETSDRASTWSTGVLPGGLAQSPDALAASGPVSRLAVLTGGGGKVVASTGDLDTWTPVVTERALATATGSTGCSLTALTGVALAGPGPGYPEQRYAGGACATGTVVPIYRLEGATGQPVGPHLPARDAPVRVERLVDTSGGLAALAGSGTGPTARLVLVTSPEGAAPWSVSAPLATGGRSVISTSVTPNGGMVVVLAGGQGGATASVISAGSAWRTLPRLPWSTGLVVAEPGGQYEALSSSGSTLDVDALVGGRWQHRASVEVPIQYGSSG